MFAVIAVGCLLTFGLANGNWTARRNDASFEDLEFFAWNLECNDAKTVCSKCFVGHPYEGADIVMHTFEYTKDPYKFQFTTQPANQDTKASFVQNDALEKFHFCSEINNSAADISRGWTWTLCLENDFTGLTVPPDCPSPVAVSRLVGHMNDAKLAGQQIMYCLPY
ncbi:uncharacterized protein LOC119720065 [Patiria miniata]|uniref:Uncharacterized protein n=1 Tax=Patiria miniata TaxID=46514 RepID=A0A913Z112_PATMI|nr:uncharacterized protein LOC119720065 [Patiria miniata]